MRGGNTRSYPSFPEIESELGYNPARFLDTPAPSEMNDLSPLATVQAFIRGMEDVATVRAWIKVEVALDQGQNGGPRQQVIAWLNHRKAELDGTASQPDEPPTTEPTGAEDAMDPTPIETPEVAESASSVTAPNATTAANTALAADGGTADDPVCPDCRRALKREVIADKVGHWCHQCTDFKEPAMEVAQ